MLDEIIQPDTSKFARWYFLLFFPNECLILCQYMTKFEAFHQSYFIKHKPLISDEFLNKRF